ncbi:MAG: hypothetical protein ABIH23_20390 [bacterium]
MSDVVKFPVKHENRIYGPDGEAVERFFGKGQAVALGAESNPDEFCVGASFRLSATPVENAAVLLRTALVGLVCADGRDRLDATEKALLSIPGEDVDRDAALFAIRVLLATLPEEPT